MHVPIVSATARRPPCRSLPLLARTVRGIEWIAAAEVRAVLGVSQVEHGHREIRFPLSELTTGVLRLGTVDDVYLVAATVDGIGRRRRDLAQLGGVAPAIDLDGLASQLDPVRTSRPERMFDVAASFLGRRNFNRYELEDALGDPLAASSRWTYLPRHARQAAPPHDGLSLRVHLADEHGTVGVRIGRRPLHRRAYRVVTRPGAVHPPVARALAILAGLRPSQWIVDPFCGVGTIPIEAALALPGVRAEGLDIAERAVLSARANARAAAIDAIFHRADAASLMYPDASVDLVVSNPPWGSIVAFEGRLARDPARAWREIRRVLKPDGRVAVLSPHADRSRAFESGSLDVVLENTIRTSGALADVVVLAPEERDRGSIDGGALFGSELAREHPSARVPS